MKFLSTVKYDESKRYNLLDVIRGITLLSMIAYHGAWDLVYIYGVKWSWYKGMGAYIWQQSICWTFIILSGFCFSLGRRPLKRGLMVFGGGLLVSVVTLIFMPQNRVLFGVLTMTGSAMLLMIPLDKMLRKVLPEMGAIISFGCFLLTRNVNDGMLGFEQFRLMSLPDTWYRNMVTTYIGFPSAGFYSTDYFSLFPWLFLFVTGYFIYGIFQKRKVFNSSVLKWNCKPFSFLGRNSLVIYLLHQPIIYGILALFFY